MLLRKITIVFFLGLTIFSFAQCKTAENKIEGNENANQSVMKDTTISMLNADKSMDLIVKKLMKIGDPATHYEYTVYTTSTRKVIKQGTFRGTDISWHDNSSLKLTPYIGMEQKPNSENPEDVFSSKTQIQSIIIKLNDL